MTSKATRLAAKVNGLAAQPTTSGVKGIALMAVFRVLEREQQVEYCFMHLCCGTGNAVREFREKNDKTLRNCLSFVFGSDNYQDHSMDL
ncbi:hypothetical protein ED312_05350 [Sinomicrobium pectinilyticum]|uniref:Uncharacterized protein n=1 Tax=Sinomicrobium pectinilyticum TaxID=1084421 RepID=A0A3N0ES40_SINP1|nr:hypothetical protein [Sinomicrobium pectinilyticum]RNL90602.1 hypothetical protein ED312_05350 [Sinomicrobium pectinilyticum]